MAARAGGRRFLLPGRRGAGYDHPGRAPAAQVRGRPPAAPPARPPPSPPPRCPSPSPPTDSPPPPRPRPPPPPPLPPWGAWPGAGRPQPPKPPPVTPAAPVLKPVFPAGMQRGTPLDLTLNGTNLADPTGLW